MESGLNKPADRTTRRGFMAGAATMAAGVLGGCKSGAERGVPTSAPSTAGFPTRPLGRCGLRIPILQQGGDYYCSARLIGRCLELGVRAFDTAENYAQRKGEVFLGSSLAKLKVNRESILLATKAYVKHPRDILTRHVPESLRRLQTDYIDIWYLHDLSQPEVLSSPDWKAAAEELKQSGQAKCFGVSCHNDRLIAVMNAAVRCGWVDVIMLRYNFRSYGDRALNEAIDACHRAGIGLIAMKTQASAVSFAERLDPFRKTGYNRHQAVLKAVWQDGRIAAIVSAMPTVRMVEENAAAAYGRLSAAERKLLRDYAAATAGAYCPGGCGGCRCECQAAVGTSLAVADILRLAMYHNTYGRRADARRLFREMPSYRRSLDGADLQAAQRACPNGLALTSLLPAAMDTLA